MGRGEYMNYPITEIIAALEKSSAYPHPTNSIRRIITGVSVIFLTGEFAYKFNKPLNLGFLDFSTLEKRKEQCLKEVKLNSLISPELYLSVVPIVKNAQREIVINCSGKAVEFAVKMKQMDPDAIMSSFLQRDKIKSSDIKEIAKEIHSFHQKALTNEEISSFGKLESIQFNWDENFKQTESYKEIINLESFTFIQIKVNQFIQKNEGLFNQRVINNKIKHCHGDFHSANVFITENGPVIFDGIVFNQRFPCSDIIAEIAFMAMDLDFYSRKDLSDLFVNEYLKLSNDQDIPKLLDFYKCYRAYIRAKINCFTSADSDLTNEERKRTISSAKEYFNLAKEYARKF